MRNAVKSLRSEAGTGAALSDGGGGGGGGTAPPLGTAVHRDEGGPRWGAAWGGREEHSTSAKPRAPSFVAREGGLRGCGDGREKTGRRWFRFGGEVSSRRGAICLSNPTDLVVVLGWARRAEGHWVPGGVPVGSSSPGVPDAPAADASEASRSWTSPSPSRASRWPLRSSASRRTNPSPSRASSLDIHRKARPRPTSFSEPPDLNRVRPRAALHADQHRVRPRLRQA